jgi:small subunit ribosomal protein S5
MVENNEVVVPQKTDTPAENKGPRRFDRDRRPRNDRRPRRETAPKEYEERTVAINRVTKVVKGGKHMRFTALTVIGNGKGTYGFGTGKAAKSPMPSRKPWKKPKKRLSRSIWSKPTPSPTKSSVNTALAASS